jgi:hypothetical protein
MGGRVGSPLPAARATMCDGAHGVTRPTGLHFICVHPCPFVVEILLPKIPGGEKQIRFTRWRLSFILPPKMAINRKRLDGWCERIILGLVLAIMVFAPLAMGAVDAWAFLVVQALTIAVMLVWTLRLWLSPRPQLLWPPLGWVVLAFAVYAVARYLTADIEYVARLEMIQVVVYAFLFFAIVNNVYRQESVQIVSYTMIFLAVGISGYAVAQLLTHSNHVWNLVSPYPGRASGTYISPNNLAGFLEMLLPLAVAYLLAGRMSAILRILLGYAALIMAAGLAVTLSRGGWVAAAAGLLALLLTLAGHRNHRWRALLLLLSCWAPEPFLSQIICPRPPATCGMWWNRKAEANIFLPRGSTSGGRRSGCGWIIFGGALARRITTIVSASTGRKTSRCAPTARTTIT